MKKKAIKEKNYKKLINIEKHRHFMIDNNRKKSELEKLHISI